MTMRRHQRGAALLAVLLLSTSVPLHPRGAVGHES